jgi:hypothetical protein
LSFAAAAVFLLAVARAAAWLPVRHAARVDPMVITWASCPRSQCSMLVTTAISSIAKSGSGFRLYFTAHAGRGRSGGRTPSVIEELLS